MRLFKFLLPLFLFFNCLGQSKQERTKVDLLEQPYFNGDSLLHHVKVLSSDEFEGRKTGTEGIIKAKQYIVKRFKSLGVLPFKKSYEQPFTFKESGKHYKGKNIIGFVNGTEFSNKYIIISAHYDHEGVKRGKIYNGADDNASGVSALIAFAEYFKTNPPKHSVILVAFDAEELGLKGAKHFVKNPVVPKEDIVLNINMDMISRSDKNELFVIGSRYDKKLGPAIKSFTSSKNIKLVIGHDGSDGKQDWTYSSDHGPFHRAGIPFLYFGVEDHEDYHKPTDDFERIHKNFYQNAVTAIIQVFESLDQSKL